MTKIFALLGLIGTVIIVVLFNHVTGWEIQSFSFWFIIPVGAILVGASAGAGLFYGYLKYNKPVKGFEYLVGALIGLSAFFGIYYVSYMTTYIDAEKNINYSFNGAPISSFELEGEQITFSRFMELTKSTKREFYFHGRPVGEVDTGDTGSSFLFYLQVLVATLAGAGVGLLIVGNKRFCNNCNKYTKDKPLFKFDIEKYEDILRDLIDCSDNLLAMEYVIQSNSLSKEKVNAYAQAELEYCPDCYDARIIVKVFKLDSDGDFKELSKFTKAIKVTDEVSHSIVKHKKI